ncbi:MAG: hypothetical protein RLN81_14630 [Balneolaceae bacterium]
MKWLTPNLTSSLDFSLTKKRFMMMGKNSSVARLYFKALPSILAFAISPFLFFDLQIETNEPFTISIQEIWADRSYSDINLEFLGFPFGKDSTSLLSQISSQAFLDGEPFTGIENIYDSKTDLLEISRVFVDGLPVHQKTFGSDGKEHASIDIFYNQHKTKRTSTRYFQLGTLKLETIFSSPDHNGKRVLKFWNIDGTLDTIMISGSSSDELINYDPEGNVVFHERYENEELVEKIK